MKDKRSKFFDHYHLRHGDPIQHKLSDDSIVWNCPCGYGYMNEREATTGHPFRLGSVGNTEWVMEREIQFQAVCNGRLR